MIAPTSLLPDPIRREVAYLKVVTVRPDIEDRVVSTLTEWWVGLGPESWAFFDLPEVTEQEAQALRIFKSPPQWRAKAFRLAGLGKYGPENEALRGLASKGYARVGKVRVELLPRATLWILNNPESKP